MNFAAIDFETANSDRGSACALGIALVENGEIASRHSWLIRALELFFDAYNITIHGITEQDVADQPTFDGIWSEICNVLGGRPIVAHTASFDLSVLRRVLRDHGLRFPTLEYYCTRVLAKVLWPQLSSHGLDFVADALGITFCHHIAVEDATACAEVAVCACHEVGVSDLSDLAAKLQIRPGHLYEGGYEPCRLPAPSKAARRSPRTFDPEHPFAGRLVVFTGALKSMVRRDAMAVVLRHGGEVADSLRNSTNYLVVGDFDYSQFRGGTKSLKLIRAENLKSAKCDIEIISEDEWLRLSDPDILKSVREAPSVGDEAAVIAESLRTH